MTFTGRFFVKEKKLRAVILGKDPETCRLRSRLCESEQFEIIKCIDPENKYSNDDLQDLDLLVDLSADSSLSKKLMEQNHINVEVISELSSELLFCSSVTHDVKDITPLRSLTLKSLQEIRRSAFIRENNWELTNHILRLTMQSLQADSGSIMLADKSKENLFIETALNLKCSGEFLKKSVRKGIAWKVVSSGKPVIIKGKSKERSDLDSSICCPLVSGESVIGVLNLNRLKHEKDLDRDDLRFVLKVADSLAGIIKQQKEEKDPSFMHSFLLGAREILDLDFPMIERLNLLMMKIANSFRGKICNLYWYDTDSGKFLVQASSSFDINRIGFGSVRLNDFFTGRVLRSSSAFTFSTKEGATGRQKLFIGQPILRNKEISGVIILYIHSDKQDIRAETEALARTGRMLEQEFSKSDALYTARLNSVKYSALSEAVFNLAEIPNIRKLAKIIATNTCLILETESCIISLFNEVMNCFEVLESFSLKGSKQAEILCKVDKAVTLKASSQNGPLLIGNLFMEGYISDQIPGRSVLSMCLRQGGRIMGAISVYDKNQFDTFQQKGFSDHDKEVFARLCHQASAAMNRFLMLKSR